MESRNLLTVLQGERALDGFTPKPDKKLRKLKSHEITTLKQLCAELQQAGCGVNELDGFFVCYAIRQIGKEFDLLRFGDDVINIELKSRLDESVLEAKVLRQMRMNYYYLKFLRRPVLLYTYVGGNGFFRYDYTADSLVSATAKEVAEKLRGQRVDYAVNPDSLFVPSNYLVSPFGSTRRFVGDEYFLTNAQQTIKDGILKKIAQKSSAFFLISANAGTGKTLLVYDIAKDMLAEGKNPLIIHCGNLNAGQNELIQSYGWNIISVKNLPTENALRPFGALIVDEAQRIEKDKLNIIVGAALNCGTPVLFSYDTAQYLKEEEPLDIGQYLSVNYPQIKPSFQRLTNRIRTNKDIASFIANLTHIGKSRNNLNYGDITVEFTDNESDLKNYTDFLVSTGWTPITYSYGRGDDPYEGLTTRGYRAAHDVIGQEFPKVVCVMDEHFYYGADGKLNGKGDYYSAPGMLYQIITRVVDKLKIIVYKNTELYINLLKIKALDKG